MATQVKEPAAVQPTLQPPKIILSNRLVPSSEAAAQVPPGCRMAYPYEVAMLWVACPDFRKILCGLPGAAWTNQDGMQSSGPYRIITVVQGGIIKVAFEGITEAQFIELDGECRSWHFRGKGLVAVGGVRNCSDWLVVSASCGPRHLAQVALVNLSPEESALQVKAAMVGAVRK